MSTATLLEAVSNKLGVVSDVALARALQLAPPVISKLRHGVLPPALEAAWGDGQHCARALLDSPWAWASVIQATITDRASAGTGWPDAQVGNPYALFFRAGYRRCSTRPTPASSRSLPVRVVARVRG